MWESAIAWDRLPAYIPACPLPADELKLPYSLSRVQPQALNSGSLYAQQLEAMQLFYTDPPLTKPSKRHKPAMKALALSTLATRGRTLEEFVGFAVRWLGYQPTMELVMKPLTVAKFMGFLLERGCAISTLKRVATHLGQAVTFVISEACPGTKRWSGEWMEQVDDWYANLNSRLCVLLTSYPSNYVHVDMTLWEAWEHSRIAWDSFTTAFQVSWSACDNVALGGCTPKQLECAADFTASRPPPLTYAGSRA